MKTRTIAVLVIMTALNLSGCDDKLVILPAVPPEPASTTFTSSSYVPIPDGSGTSTYLFVSGMGGTIDARLYKVSINITHPYTGDLDIFLQAPNGSTIELTSDNGGAGANYSGTIFKTGGTPIASGSAPFAGTYAPEQAFTSLSGSVDGPWSLIMNDDATSDVGALNGWSLTIVN